MIELVEKLVLVAPALLLGWAAVRRAEALVIWAKRRSPRERSRD
jgi:hypothetical protein